MKRLISKLLKRKPSQKVYHINYSDFLKSDIAFPGHTICIGTVRDEENKIVGQFHYAMDEFFGIVQARKEGANKYYIAKDPKSDWAVVDAYIHPVMGALNNAHSLREFLKMEFGI